jgi:hypothetical protein
MRAKRHKGNRLDFRFFAVARDVLEHPAFLRLSPYAKALLLDLGAQYRGDNNGNLACAWKVMKPRGWRSEATLHKAKHELIDAGFLFEARKGYRPNVCGLYALTWLLLDADPRHDCSPSAFERWAFLRREPAKIVRLIADGVTTGRVVAAAG